MEALSTATEISAKDIFDSYKELTGLELDATTAQEWADTFEALDPMERLATFVEWAKELEKSNFNVEYLKELKAINYEDSVSIYKELYDWKISIIVNESENDSVTDMASVSKYSNWYFHVSLTGGAPNEEIQLKYKGIFPAGHTFSDQWTDKWSDGWSGWASFYYDTPVYGEQGTFKFKVFDANGNLLAEKSVRITG